MALPLIFAGAAVGVIAKTALAAIGVGVVTYVGLDTVLSYATTQMQGSLGAIGPAAGILGLARFDEALMFIISGYNVRISLMTLKRLKII